jgi:hypothetical protein
MADAFEVATTEGARKVQFVADAYRREVQVLVDDAPATAMPFPTDSAPHHEVAFTVADRSLVGVAQLANGTDAIEDLGLRFDVFANGFSLVDGGTLEAARLRALKAVGRYPGVFRAIDVLLRVIPAAAIPGIVIAITRRSGDNVNEPATTLALLAVCSGVVVVGTAAAAWAWRWIRARSQLTVPRRAILGSLGILGSYVGSSAVAILVLAGLVNVGLIAQSACSGAEEAATANGGVGSPTGGMLLVSDPGPDFTLVGEGPMTLEQAAASRVDSMTLDQLRKAGFESAYFRDWIRDDGTMLANDVFSFATPAGAESFHLSVTEYACHYSTELFPVPGGGVGLRILYGSGDPVRDQVAWIDGTRRVIIALGYHDDAADHSEILALVEQARGGVSPD